ncbi:MAG: hypothetical protein OEZ02_01320 [Anaerolineae bacterium]|nr:hypothetical protein [Anaerolineae bacterium]
MSAKPSPNRTRPVFYTLFAILIALFFARQASPFYPLVFVKLLGKTSMFATVNLLRIIMALFFITLIWVTRWLDAPPAGSPLRQPANPDGIPLKALRSFVVGVFLAAAVLITVNAVVNPRGIYAIKLFSPWAPNARAIKINAYQNLPASPDLVILGSSRAFTISPQYINAKLGQSAYNWSLEGGKLQEFLIQTKFMLHQAPEDVPEVLLIEVWPASDVLNDFIVSSSPTQLLPFMPPSMMFKAALLPIQELFNVHQFSESLYVLRQNLVGGDLARGWEFDAMGGGQRDKMMFDQALSRDIRSIAPQAFCETLQPGGVQILHQMVGLADQHGISLVFFYSARHPLYHAEIIRTHPAYQRCHQELLDFMHQLAGQYPYVFFLDYSLLENFNGIATADGFYDGQHMTQINNNLLIDAATDSLRQAYDLAISRRQGD